MVFHGSLPKSINFVIGLDIPDLLKMEPKELFQTGAMTLLASHFPLVLCFLTSSLGLKHYQNGEFENAFDCFSRAIQSTGSDKISPETDDNSSLAAMTTLGLPLARSF